MVEWEKIADFQETTKGGAVRCLLCPHGCVLQDGHTGSCRARTNKGGVLYSTSYGRLCSLQVDPMEKKPLYHFYPGEPILSLATGGCTMRCLNCQNWELSQSTPQEVMVYSLTPEVVVERAVSEHIHNVAFTYTEPTVFFEYMFDTAVLGKERGLRSVMISNGYINPAPLKKISSVLSAANIDVKAFDEEIHKKLTGARLGPVLDTLLTLKKEGVWLEITFLLVPDYSDDLVQVERFCTWLINNGFAHTPLHFSRFFPMYKLANSRPTPVGHVLDAARLAEVMGMRYVYPGNLTESQGQDTRCPTCGQVVVERSGYTVKTIKLEKGRCTHCGQSVAGVW